MSYSQPMHPVDGSDPHNFVGIDYTMYLRGPSIYNAAAVEDRVSGILQEYLTAEGLAARRCIISGIGAAGTGPPPFFELLQWIQENWAFFAGVASTILTWIAVVKTKLHLLKRKYEDKILDPYKPSIVIELCVRTKQRSASADREAVASFRSILTLMPELSERLTYDLPRQKVSFRIYSSNPVTPYACLKVPEVRRADVIRILNYFDRKDFDKEVKFVLLYRQFGFLKRIEGAKTAQDVMRLMMRM